MAQFYPQPLLLLLLLISECRGGSPVLASASLEEDVVLPCSVPLMTDKDTCFRVKLIKHATNSSQVILAWPEISKFKGDQRVKWQADKNGQMSITLTKSQKSDEGLYGCEIWKGWDSILVQNISLKVKDCKNHQPVKAALSTPVTLTCPVVVDITAGRQGPPKISWAMLKAGNPVPVNSKTINVASLTIESMNDNDSGWYRCNYTLDQTQRCFDINLLVSEEHVLVDTTVPGLTTSEINVESDKKEISEVFLAVVVASVITAIAIMAALMGLFIYCRRNSQTVTQQTQRPPAGSPIEYGGYEIVNTLSENRTNDRFNSLYQHFPDESLCTFWNE